MKVFYSVFIALLCVSSSFASAPSFTSPQDINCDNVIIDVGTCASPCIADWDGDGLDDLIIGQWGDEGDGRVRFYPNTNTNDSPIYTYFNYIQSDGEDINLSYG